MNIQMHSTKSLIEKKRRSKTHHDSHPLRAGALAAPTSAPPVAWCVMVVCMGISGHPFVRNETLLRVTLPGRFNISHLGKHRLKMPFLGDMLVPWRVIPYLRTISR